MPPYREFLELSRQEREAMTATERVLHWLRDQPDCYFKPIIEDGHDLRECIGFDARLEGVISLMECWHELDWPVVMESARKIVARLGLQAS